MAAAMMLPKAVVPSRRDCPAIFNHFDDTLKEGEEYSEASNMLYFTTHDKKNRSVSRVVEDVRGREGQFSLEEQGFTYRRHTSKLSTPEEFCDMAKVKDEYWPECVDLIRQVCPTATHIQMFQTITRKSSGKNPEFQLNASLDRHPAVKTHVDTDFSQSVRWALQHLPEEEARQLIKRRFRVVNVWRPMATVYKSPLAMMDLRSVAPADVASLEARTPEGKVHVAVAVRASEEQRWYYKYMQRPDEPLVFLQCDTSPKARGWGQVPHCSFIDEEEEGRDDRYQRRSIEARALVFYDEEGIEPGEELIQAILAEPK